MTGIMIDIMRSKSLDRLRGHPLFMSARIRAGSVSRTEDASGAAGAAFGTARIFRTIGGRFRYRVLRVKAAAAAELRTSHTKKEADLLVDLLLYYTVMSHVFGMLRKR